MRLNAIKSRKEIDKKPDALKSLHSLSVIKSCSTNVLVTYSIVLPGLEANWMKCTQEEALYNSLKLHYN